MKESTNAITKVVAGNIRKIREFKQYTQINISAKLGISQNAYSKIELGYSKLTVERLFKLAEIMEVEVNDLLCLDPVAFRKLITPPERPLKYPIKNF